MGKAFYKRLSYTIGNEDWKTEIAALKIEPNDRILAITASGDRPLNLLSMPCRELISIDANPIQNALCELKTVALKELEYNEYLSFIGVTASRTRRETFSKLKTKLSSDSLKLLEQQKKGIEKGILYQGKIEKLLKIFSFCLLTIFGKTLNTLFSLNNLEEQKAFIEKKWNVEKWKKIVSFVLSPIVTRLFLKDPGLYENIDPSIKMPHYIHDRLFTSLKKVPVKENILISLICFGKVFEEGFCPYLTLEGTRAIQKQSHKIQLKTYDAISYLHSCEEGSFDCFSLSDIASYMNKEDFYKLCSGIVRAARPGARFCIRQFLSNYTFPKELAPYFKRDEALEKTLEEEDRCAVYRFLTGTIVKP